MMWNFGIYLFLLCFSFALRGCKFLCTEEQPLHTPLPGFAMIVLRIPQGSKSANQEPNQLILQFPPPPPLWLGFLLFWFGFKETNLSLLYLGFPNTVGSLP